MVKIINPTVELMTEIDEQYVLKHLEKCIRNCYKSEDKISDDDTSARKMIAKIVELDHTAMLEHFNITFKMTCDVGVYKDITRHRVGTAYAIESTRYCNYSKDKYDNQIKVIKPCHIEEESELYNVWLDSMNSMEKYYNLMADNGAKTDQLRMLLPHSTAADVIMTANIRSLRHILKLRCAKAAHPSVQEVMKMLLVELYNKLPVLFSDLYEEFINGHKG